jgi:hypothetical protein
VTDVTRRADHDGGTGLLEVALRELQRRRRDRWLVAAVLVLAVVAAFAVLLVEDLAVAASPWIAVGFLAVTLLYVASVVFQEDRSRRAVRALVEERGRLAAADEEVPPLEVLHEVLRSAGAVGPLPDVLAELLRGATALTGAARGAIALHDGEVLTVVAAAGSGAPPVGARLPEDDGATWRAIRDRTLIEIGHGSEWGMVADASALAVPLDGDVEGALVVERAPDEGRFTAEERLAASVLALQAALAVREASCLERLADQAAALAEQATALDETTRERDEVRRECDEARRERDEQTAALDETTRERDEARRERDEQTAALDETTRERDEVRRECDEARRERDEQTAALDETTRERDEATRERDEATRERDEQTAALDEATRERDEARRERDLARLECDEARRERDEATRERDAARAAETTADLVAVRAAELRDLVERLHGLSASVTGTVQLLLHRGEGFPLARRQALLDDVLRKTSRQRALLTELEELAPTEPPSTESPSALPGPA